jgi:hypothetical protein
MTGALTLLGLWAGFTVATVAALLWAANHDTQADLPDAPEPHDPATCDVCKAADDLAARVDLVLWNAELRSAS